MRISPKVPALIYFLMGAVFLYAAYKSSVSSASVWNITTVLLIFVTTLMFGASWRLMRFYYKWKKHQKKK